MRARFHLYTDVEVLIHQIVPSALLIAGIFRSGHRRYNGKQRQALAIQHHFQLMRAAIPNRGQLIGILTQERGFGEAFDILIPIAHQAHLNLVSSVLRERVLHQRAAAAPQGQLFEMRVLR